jgi:hypothetical protein
MLDTKKRRPARCPESMVAKLTSFSPQEARCGFFRVYGPLLVRPLMLPIRCASCSPFWLTSDHDWQACSSLLSVPAGCRHIVPEEEAKQKLPDFPEPPEVRFPRSMEPQHP